MRSLADELGTPLIDAPTGMCAVAELLGASASMIIVADELRDMTHEEFTHYVRRLDARVPIIRAQRRQHSAHPIAA